MLDLVWSFFLYKSLQKSFIWGWSWFEAPCFTDPLRKSSFEAGSAMSCSNEVEHYMAIPKIIFQSTTEWHHWARQTLCELRCLAHHHHTYTIADSCMTILDLLGSQLAVTVHWGSCGSFVDNEHTKSNKGFYQTVLTQPLRDSASNSQTKIVK